MHLLAAFTAWLATTEPTPGGGDGPSSTDFLKDSPIWLKTVYVIIGGGSGLGGLIALFARYIWPRRHQNADTTAPHHSGARRAETNAERIDRYLDKAETDLASARAENDRLEEQVHSLSMQLQEVRDALARSREAEASARGTIDTLTDLLREQRGGGQA